MERHFAFFRQGLGTYVREWKGPVASPPTWIVRLGWTWLLDRWATQVSQPRRGEIGLDVTHLGWPVGDFCYCRFDEIDRMLEWGPRRRYIEVRLDTLEIVANWESHRPVRNAVAGQHVLDITGTALEPYHGSIFGRFVHAATGWRIEPRTDLEHVPAATQRALAEAPIDLDVELMAAEPVYARR